jgi:hypothetical protein
MSFSIDSPILEYLEKPGCNMWIIKMRVSKGGFGGAAWRWGSLCDVIEVFWMPKFLDCFWTG